jgi:aminopeptidase N
MKRLFILLTAFSLFLFPILSKADNYPINKKIDIKHYSFALTLSDSNDEIIGSTNITIHFKQAGIQNFRLDLINQSIERKGKGMLVDGVYLDKNSVSYSHQKDALIINLPSPSTLNQTLVFTIKYHGIPSDGLRIGATKFGDRSFFNENWPNRGRHWLPLIDHPYDKATSEFIVKAPAHYKVISNGLLLEESDLGDNVKLTHWKQSVPVSSWLFVLGVADFAVKYVDEVVVYESEEDLLQILKAYNIDIRILGEEYKGKPFTGSDLPLESYFNKRSHKFSTTELRNRIITNYQIEEYKK